MAARHPASSPSHLPPRTPAGAGPETPRALSVHDRSIAVVLGFVVGGGAVALPFLVNESAHPVGLWVAILESTFVVTVMLALGLPLAHEPRQGRRDYFGVGLLSALAALGWLLAVGTLLLVFRGILFPG